jgi:hypothetical protein
MAASTAASSLLLLEHLNLNVPSQAWAKVGLAPLLPGPL